MPRKTYTEEFKRDAVALYENSAGTSIQKIANDLGINRMTLKNWIGPDPRIVDTEDLIKKQISG